MRLGRRDRARLRFVFGGVEHATSFLADAPPPARSPTSSTTGAEYATSAPFEVMTASTWSLFYL